MKTLGIDLSTQSIKGCVFDTLHRRITAVESISFDDPLFASFGLACGVQFLSADKRVVHSSPLLWISALFELFRRIGESCKDMQLGAVSVSAQMHGTVYWAKRLTPAATTLEDFAQLLPYSSPVWMDSSTWKECEELESMVGGASELAVITGSTAHERFSASQIVKFLRAQSKDAVRDLVHIDLVSSFVCSVLTGSYAPIDFGDASGTNLFDVQHRYWFRPLLDKISPQLASLLPSCADGSQLAGVLSPCFCKLLKLPEDQQSPGVVVGTGDNFSSGLFNPSGISLSMGTSDTIAFFTGAYRPQESFGHVFSSPFTESQLLYFPLLCFANGDLSRRSIVPDPLQTDSFLRLSAASAGKYLAVHYVVPEITPHCAVQGPLEAIVAVKDGIPVEHVSELSCGEKLRAVIETRLVSMLVRSIAMGMSDPHDREHSGTKIVFAGGASQSTEIAQIAANIFQLSVFSLANRNPNLAALGAAVRAWHGVHFAESRSPPSTSLAELVQSFDSELFVKIADPDPSFRPIYSQLRASFELQITHSNEF
eukprot:ANDGO_06244.mRNA.1 putative sugar kinase R08D7.7